MARDAFSIVVGYLIMVAWVVGTLTLGWSTLGSTWIFEEGSYQVTHIWLAMAIGLSALGAILGGYVCTMLAEERQAVRVLALLVFVLGLVFAVSEARSGRQDEVVPVADRAEVEILKFSDARSVAIQPQWYNFIIPPIGAVGVYLGGMLRLRRLFN